MQTLRTTIENRPLCQTCNKNLAAKTGRQMPDGTWYFVKECKGCFCERKHSDRNVHKRKWHRRNYAYTRHKKLFCEKCSFMAVNPCQLDVDHIDGNRKNNDISNLQTLCANCHRLKTHENGESVNTKLRAA